MSNLDTSETLQPVQYKKSIIAKSRILSQEFLIFSSSIAEKGFLTSFLYLILDNAAHGFLLIIPSAFN